MGVSVAEHNIEKDHSAKQAHRSLGGRGVPLVDIEGIVIKGYTEQGIRDAVEGRRKGGG